MSSRIPGGTRSPRPGACTRRRFWSGIGPRASPPRRSILRLARRTGGSGPSGQCGAGWRPSTRDGWVAENGTATPTSWCGSRRRAPSGTGPTRWWTPSSQRRRKRTRYSRSPCIRSSWNKLRARRRRRCISCWAVANWNAFASRSSRLSNARSGSGLRNTAPIHRQRIRSRSGSAPGAIGTTHAETSGGRTITFPWWPTRRGTSERVWSNEGSPPSPRWRASAFRWIRHSRGCHLLRYGASTARRRLNSPDANGGCRSTN